MPSVRRGLPLLRSLSNIVRFQPSAPISLITYLLFVSLVVPFHGLRAQTPATPSTPTTGRVIVKIRPSLAAATESQLSATPQGQPMKIRAGHSGNTRIDAFLLRQGAQQISPMYPQILRIKKQHGWSDAQVAEHIRQHFDARSRRVTQARAVPEISRTYVLELGSLSTADRTRAVQRLKADRDVEFAEPEHTFSTKQLPNDPFLASSGTWGQPYQDLWGLFAIGAPAAWDTAQGDGVVVAVVDTGVDYNHPDIAANMWTNVNEIDGNSI